VTPTIGRFFPAALALALGFAFSLQPTNASAQLDYLNGRYAVDRVASADIRAAIEETIADMGFLRRPIARIRLRNTNPIGTAVSIEVTDERARITFDESPPMESLLDGTPVRWRREDGEEFDLETVGQGDALVQTLTTEQGSRTTRFQLSSDGFTLALVVSVSSPQLPRPLEYTLIYRRRVDP